MPENIRDISFIDFVKSRRKKPSIFSLYFYTDLMMWFVTNTIWNIFFFMFVFFKWIFKIYFRLQSSIEALPQEVQLVLFILIVILLI